jgi:hypothetical protein
LLELGRLEIELLDDGHFFAAAMFPFQSYDRARWTLGFWLLYRLWSGRKLVT